MINGFHLGLAPGKPFNPILGETFQCKAGNSMCYAEQTSHHPPITTLITINPKFKLYGSIGMEAYSGANSMNVKITGKQVLEFNDGTIYNFTYPEMQINGIMVGRRYVNWLGSLKIDDTVIIKYKFTNFLLIHFHLEK